MKMKKKYKIPRIYRNLFKKYATKYLFEEDKNILLKADDIYDEFKREVPDIGGKNNMLAGNLDMALAFFAFCKASDGRVTGRAIEEIGGWMYSKISFIGKLIDFNKPWVAKLMYRVYVPYANKVEQHKARGEWGNSWGVIVNPEGYNEGCSFHLVGCPIVDFAKKHGFMDIVPYMCDIDHMSANLMNAKLLRKYTVASGFKICDYWYVGNKSEHIKE